MTPWRVNKDPVAVNDVLRTEVKFLLIWVMKDSDSCILLKALAEQSVLKPVILKESLIGVKASTAQISDKRQEILIDLNEAFLLNNLSIRKVWAKKVLYERVEPKVFKCEAWFRYWLQWVANRFNLFLWEMTQSRILTESHLLIWLLMSFLIMHAAFELGTPI